MRICTFCSAKTARVCRECRARWCSTCGEIDKCPNCHPQTSLVTLPASRALVVARELPAALVADVAHMAALSERDIADSTRDKYERAWRRFVAWSVSSLPMAWLAVPV